MRIKVLKVSDCYYEEERIINTLQQLKEINDYIIIDWNVDIEAYGKYDAIVFILNR